MRVGSGRGGVRCVGQGGVRKAYEFGGALVTYACVLSWRSDR